MNHHFRIGPFVRRALGPLERHAADRYRAFFGDIDLLARSVRAWAPASTILEVGCGEGSLTERLALAYPEAAITGIDITPRVGRLFRGDRARVVFRQETIEEFAAAHPASFDLVVLCDVMHHVPWEMHEAFLQSCRRALRPGGVLVLKDWERIGNVPHLLNYLSDRVITGDRVRYRTADDFRGLLERTCAPARVARELRLPPWRNNVAFFLEGGADVPVPDGSPSPATDPAPS